jgi:hypothetical protein
MKKCRCTEEQIGAGPTEGEAGVPGVEILRTHGISRKTYFNAQVPNIIGISHRRGNQHNGISRAGASEMQRRAG